MNETPLLKWGALVKDNETGDYVKYFPAHVGQRKILESNARIVCALGGINSGKTSCCLLALANEIIKHRDEPVSKQKYMIVAPTFGVVTSSTKDRWMEIVEDWEPLKGKYYAHQLNPRYELANGAIVYFRSADSDFTGLKPLAIMLDEGGFVARAKYHEICRRLTTGGRLFIGTTPYLEYDWIRDEIIEQCDKGDKQYFYHCLLSSDNPTTDPSMIATARSNFSEWEYKLFYEGKFGHPPHLVYDFHNCIVEMPEDGLPDAIAFIAGVDFGGTDPTCVLLGLQDKNDCLWVWNEYYKDGRAEALDIEAFLADVRLVAAKVKEKTKKTVAFWCDHRPELIQALRRSNLNARKANKKRDDKQSSIALGISLVQARIRTGRLKIIKGACPNLREESFLYKFPMQDGEPFGNIPIDKHNHACDALRYMVRGVDRLEYGKVSRQLNR